MKKVILWALLVSCTSTLVSHADSTTSANLLNNNTFNENTDGWTLSDSNVKRDANSYNDAGNSPTVRFKGQNSTITQSVDTSSLEADKEITDITIKYHGYGCGNTGNQWCTAGADDTVVTNVTLSNGTDSEVSTNTVAVPFEDGWTHHSFTESINDTFITDETSITFTLQGIDTGDSNSWLGPITDNYELLITYQDFVVQQQVEEQIQQQVVQEVVQQVVQEIVEQQVIQEVVEQQVVQEIVEQQVVQEIVEQQIVEEVVQQQIIQEIVEQEVINTMVGGLDLDISITNDIILDQSIVEIRPIEIEIPIDMGIDVNMDTGSDMDMDMNMNMANIEMPADINLQSQPIEIEIPQQIDTIVEIRVAPVIPTDIPDLANLTSIDEVQEIQEMPVIKIPVSADLEVEMEMDSVEIEQPEELNSSNMEEDLAEMQDDIIESVDELIEVEVEVENEIQEPEEVAENKENNNESKETTAEDGGDEKSQLSKSSETEVKSDDSKVVKKSKSKDSKKSKKNDVKKSTVKKDKSEPKTKTVVQKSNTESSPGVLSIDSLGHMVLPAAYLQTLQDTLKIVETVSITQDMIYEQNTYDLVQFTFESSFGGDSPDRFNSLLGVESRYQSPTYRNSGQ